MTDLNVTAAELRQFIERAEQLTADRKDIGEQLADVFAEAKGRGYDVKCLKEVLRLRKMKPDDLAEFEAVVDVYRAAAGI
jgi:uncharacterized protein (UPF0335 family)